MNARSITKCTLRLFLAAGIFSLAMPADVSFASEPMPTYMSQQAKADWQHGQKLASRSAARTGIAIMPIDQAKFLKGQRFDFEVEVNGNNPTALNVTVNGKDAAKYFGKKPVITVHDDYTSYRIDNVSFKARGEIDIAVAANTSKGALKRHINYKVVDEKAKKKAKNVILFVGDGMSPQIKEAARILSKGIYEGRYNGHLSMENLPNMAFVTTSGYDSLVTDSANSASAYNTGHKSVVNAMGVYENRTKDPLDDPKVETIAEIVKRTKDMGVGIVSTAAITDATPAAVTAHTRRRAEQPAIAADYLAEYHRPDVILGGGAQFFLPLSTNGSKRKDEQNVIADFEKAGFQFAGNRQEMLAANDNKPLLGLFTMNHMNVYMDREFKKNPEVLKNFPDQPNLIEMTAKAIDILSKNPNGFYLMSEGACIDKQLHTMDWQRAAYDTIELDQAVAYATDWAKANGDDTLIVVIADHSHGVSLTGTYHEHDGVKGRDAVRTYAEAGWPTFADRNADGYPDDPDADVTLALQYANFPDHYENYRFQAKPTSPAITGENGKIIGNPYRAPKGARYIEGSLPSTKETQEVHSADDIVVMAGGPGSEEFHGLMDNTEIFFAIMRALGIDATK